MHTFARLVTTPENCSPPLAVGRVADSLFSGRQRGQANPLFLHGPAGTGKTHLVSALAHDVSRRCPDLTIGVVPVHDFTVSATSDGEGTAAWLCDLVVVEDM